jgi:hypothetical protein
MPSLQHATKKVEAPRQCFETELNLVPLDYGACLEYHAMPMRLWEGMARTDTRLL